MQETIYKLYEDSLPPILPDREAQRKQTIKDSKIHLLRSPNYETSSKAVVAAELLHLNSKKTLTSAFTIQRRQHGSFGLPKTAYVRQKEDLKPLGSMHLTGIIPNARQYEFQPTDKTHFKPDIPALEDGPLQGLSSNVDFIQVNRLRAQSLKASQVPRTVDYLSKPSYGSPPDYLDRVKSTISSEKEYLTMIATARNPQVNTKETLTTAERETLLVALKRKHFEINRIYQGITHISKVYSGVVKRRKEACEKELLQIEKDMQILQKELIFVDKTL